MTDPRGFLRIERRVAPYRPVPERVRDHADVGTRPDEGLVREQARRCMDCGVPFCHHGCPLGNLIPDWNDLVERGLWREASDRLHATNSFPEWTGKLCPAPCEEACVVALTGDAVTIKQVELAIVDRAWDEGWITPEPAARETGRSVAVVGSGPAGLAAAQQLARAGHAVTVYERDDSPGGLLRYGIPDFKLEKALVDRRVAQLEAEGVRFATGVDVGRGTGVDALRAEHDAVVLATGAQAGRELAVPGRELGGVHLALPYLVQRNRQVAGREVGGDLVSAAGRRVAILGGGDTSADCLGCAHREGVAAVAEIAHGPQPPTSRTPLRTWPEWPRLQRTYAAHLEGGDRVYGLETVRLEGEDGHVRRLVGKRVEWPGYDGIGPRPAGRPVDDGEVVLDVDLVLLAIGFSGVETGDPLYADLGVALTRRDTVDVGRAFETSVPGVFAAGDCVRGADLIVTAIADGRECARAVDRFLEGRSWLPARDRPSFAES